MLLNNTPLFIGTSGYNHEDWKGTFAPVDTHNYDLLTLYADKGFNFLELAFTFYRMPEPDKIKHILLRTTDRVKFSVRIPRVLIKEPANEELFNEFMKGLTPMNDAGLLSCVYADYHSSFSASKKNQDLILYLRERFKVPFFAELPNRTWYKGRITDFFKENDIGMTIIDMPQVKGLAPYYPVCLNNNIYLKLYGRSKGWVTADGKVLDYSYTGQELKNFISDLVDKSVVANAIFVVFANVADGRAPVDALKMMDMVKNGGY